MAVIYEYGSNGLIGGTTSNNSECTVPVFSTAKNGNFTLTLPDNIKTNVTCANHDGTIEVFPDYAVVGGGWSFVLDKDNFPVLDSNGNYQIIPPQPQPASPTSADYAVLAAIKQGILVIGKDLHDDYIIKLNQSLNTVGLPPIEGTSLVPLPVYTAVCLPWRQDP